MIQYGFAAVVCSLFPYDPQRALRLYQDWLLVPVVTVIGTFWIEIRKLIFWRGGSQQ